MNENRVTNEVCPRDIARPCTAGRSAQSWRRAGGRHAYASLRRRLDFITGELGTSANPVALDDLPLVVSPAEAPPGGCRVHLGSLLHGHSKTWSAGGSERALVEQLDWIARQLQLRLYAFMAVTAPAAV